MTDSMITPDMDYGPLAALIGSWRGDQGRDVAPESDGIEHNDYYEQIDYSAAGKVTNAEQQRFAIVHYRLRIARIKNDRIFHDQSGYWSWDAETGLITHSLVLPRGMGVVATGQHQQQGECLSILVTAKAGSGIMQSPFMADKARTEGFEQKMIIDGDRLSYEQTTSLHIYGKAFAHTDSNTLRRLT